MVPRKIQWFWCQSKACRGKQSCCCPCQGVEGAVSWRLLVPIHDNRIFDESCVLQRMNAAAVVAAADRTDYEYSDLSFLMPFPRFFLRFFLRFHPQPTLLLWVHPLAASQRGPALTPWSHAERNISKYDRKYELHTWYVIRYCRNELLVARKAVIKAKPWTSHIVSLVRI